jgi:hypothetical protein
LPVGTEFWGKILTGAFFIFFLGDQILKKMFSDIFPNIDKNVHWYSLLLSPLMRIQLQHFRPMRIRIQIRTQGFDDSKKNIFEKNGNLFIPRPPKRPSKLHEKP